MRSRSSRSRKGEGTPGKGRGERKGVVRHIRQILLDVVSAVVIVAVVMGVLYVYSGVWPPLVVVESRSMQHSNSESSVGVIDTGDLVVVKVPGSLDDITTYVEGRVSGHYTYGEYGDVIVYRKEGSTSSTPIIHRAILYARYNQSSDSFDLPGLRGLKYGEDWTRSDGISSWRSVNARVTLLDVGYAGKKVDIDLTEMQRYSGYVTMGDNARTNTEIDQVQILPGKLVRFEWVVGVARGELPWFGLIKLCVSGDPADKRNCELAPSNSFTDLWLSLGILVLMPFMYDISRSYISRREAEGERFPATPHSAALLNLVLPGTGYMHAGIRPWSLVGAYVFSIYFFLLEVLLMYALGFPAGGVVLLLGVNALMAVHVFILLRRCQA